MQDPIGNWVRNAREHRRWTQTQLADEMGVTKANVSHWERGAHEPSYRQLIRIKHLTGYPLPEVGGPADWPFPQVPREMLSQLSPQQLNAVQAGLLVALATVQYSFEAAASLVLPSQPARARRRAAASS